jgi:transglutaminase-like putative cysteine protease
MRFPKRLGLMLLVLAIARPAHAEGPRWEPVTAAELAEDKPQLEPQAAAEILSYRLEIDDTRTMGREMTSWIRYKIYDPARAIDITRVSRFWSGLANRDYEIMARLTLPDGTSRVFDEHDMRGRDVAEEGRANGAFGFMSRSDANRMEEKFLAVTGVIKGAVLDVWQSEPNTYKTDWLVNSIQRTDAPIRQFEYVSRYIPDIKVQHRGFVLNPSGGKMAHDEKAGVLRFTAQNLPSIRREPFSPPDTYFSLTIIEAYEPLDKGLNTRSFKVALPASVPLSLGPWAYFSTAQDYQDADKGYAGRHVRDKAASLVAGTDDPREKARRIFNFVQALYQRFRYRADLENWYTRYIGSMDELVDLDKIDSTILEPADFHYLFIALARSAGLECHSVYHPPRTAFPFKMSLVSEHFLSGWSIAVKTGEGWMLCDPTTDVPLAFGELPWEMEGQPALMALPRQQAFLNIPPLAAEGSVVDTRVEATLDPNGNLEGTCVRTLTGHAAHVVRERLYATGQEEWSAMAKALFDLESSSCEVSLQGVDGVSAPEEPLRLRASVRWPAYAAAVGDRMTFALSVWNEGRPPVLGESRRTTPVFFHFPSVEKQTVTVHLPPGYHADSVPKPIGARSADFAYSLAVTQDPGGGTLEVERSSTIGTIEIPVAEYAQARDWFRRISLADQIGVILSRDPGRTTPNPPIP